MIDHVKKPMIGLPPSIAGPGNSRRKLRALGALPSAPDPLLAEYPPGILPWTSRIGGPLSPSNCATDRGDIGRRTCPPPSGGPRVVGQDKGPRRMLRTALRECR